jgi:hypothetical protein
LDDKLKRRGGFKWTSEFKFLPRFPFSSKLYDSSCRKTGEKLNREVLVRRK